MTELVEEVIKKTGYREMLQAEKTIESQSRLENIDEFLSVTKAFEDNSEDKSLVGFLTDLALVADIDQLDENTEEATNMVTLMTLHSAKGLEYPVVFLLGLEEGVFLTAARLWMKRRWKKNAVWLMWELQGPKMNYS